MNKRQILASLNKIANELDNKGLYRQATSITGVMKRLVVADEFNILDESNETPESPSATNEQNTNPEKENIEYIEAIKKDIEWLGNGQYKRKIGGKLFTKSLMGKPTV